MALSSLELGSIGPLSKAVLNFDDKLNVITGETGVGKSVLLTTLKLLKGQNFKNIQTIKETNPDIFVNGVFSNLTSTTYKVIESTGANYTEDDDLIIARKLINGKFNSYLNGFQISSSALNLITEELLQICGQNDQIQLTKETFATNFIDEFGSLQNLREEYLEKKKAVKEKESEIEQFQNSQNDLEFEIWKIKQFLEDFDKVKPMKDELALVKEQIKISENSVQYLNLLSSSRKVLNDDDNSLMSNLAILRQHINNLKEIDKSFEQNLSEIDNIDGQLSGIFSKIASAISSSDFEDVDIDALQSRLSDLKGLELKHKDNLNNLIEKSDRDKLRLDELEKPDNYSEKLNDELKKCSQELNNKSNQLLEERRKAANRLEEIVNQQLEDLALKGAVFEVEVSQDLSVKFLYSPHKKMKPLPIMKIASGGELSRLQLALEIAKSLNQNDKSKQVFVFDEIDSGIGGQTAVIIAQKLQELAQNNQIILVTHQASIAATADKHFLIKKVSETDAKIEELDDENKEYEIARMLSGNVTQTSLEHAKELLKQKEKQNV